MDIVRFLTLIAGVILSVGAAAPTPEPLGQSSRLTSLVISEIMYHPSARADGKNLEFIELFNSLSTPEDISGYRLDGDVQFAFPAGTVIPARGFLVVASKDGGVPGAIGPFEGALPNDRGTVQLRHRTGLCSWKRSTIPDIPGLQRLTVQVTRWFWHVLPMGKGRRKRGRPAA